MQTQEPRQASKLTKIILAICFLSPLGLVVAALLEDPYPEMTEANRAVRASAYEMCRTYEKAGYKQNPSCDEMLRD